MTPDLYRHVPKGRVANLKWRLWLLDEARKSRQVRDGLFEVCRRDILFWFNAFVWTFDPRTEGKKLPFVTYPFQDRAILFMQKAIRDSQKVGSDNKDVVIEKSRDQGASWLSLGVMDHFWHFEGGNSFLMISRSQDLVDKRGDPDSLFWKLDFIHDHLPEWMMPKGWTPRKHRLDMHFENPDNGSTMDGAATTAMAGVGGRRTAMFIDEFSRIAEAQELLSGTADTTRCRIFNFTPWGSSHPSAKLAMRKDVPKLRLGWWEHPEKNPGLYKFNALTQQVDHFACKPDGTLETLPGPTHEFPRNYKFVMDGVLRSPVYDAEDRRRANRREMAVMWDIDYAGSDYQYYPKTLILDLQREKACPPYWEGDVQFDRDTALNPRLVPVPGGPLRLWVNPVSRGGQLVLPPAVYGAGADVSEGTGHSPSCFSAFHQTTREMVLEYATPFLSAEKFGVVCVALCRLLSTRDGYGARFCWEMQGPGVRLGRKVVELGYGNIWLRQPVGRITTRSSDTPGWVPTPENKRFEHGNFREALATGQAIVRSHECLEECLQYLVDNTGDINHAETVASNDPSGARVNHGDRPVAAMLAYKMIGPMRAEEAGPADGEIPVLSLAWRHKFHQDQERMEESLKGW